jgi:hypothetical protein
MGFLMFMIGIGFGLFLGHIAMDIIDKEKGDS